MHQLLPEAGEVDPAAAHARASRPKPPGRPWTALNMVVSLDGATAVDGVSGGLGGPADKEVFRAVRGAVDAIVAAAGTVRAERYGPPRTSPAAQTDRVARGQTAHPRMVIITASLDLDPDAPVFTEATERPLVCTTDGAPAGRRAALEAVADVVSVGSTRVDMAALGTVLVDRGLHRVVAEGGPSLNGQLLAADMIDEINLTTAPLLLGGTSARLATVAATHLQTMVLAHLWEADDMLFARYVRQT